MGDLSLFLKKNKKEKKNTFYAASKAFADKDGKPVLWELKPMNTSDSEELRAKCTYDVQVTGKPGVFRQKTNMDEYLHKLLASCVVYPDLQNAELQDSYGVKTPEELLLKLLDDPTEYNEFASFVQSFNGMDESMNDKVEEAKN